MSELTNEEFIDFIKNFKGKSFKNHKFYDTITEISRKKSGKKDALIENDFLMYSLDDIAKGSKELSQNLPKTADALFYKEDDENNISLYFIEFKFHNLDDPDTRDLLDNIVDEIFAFENKFKCISKYKNDLNKIKKYYGDDVTHTLILKPIESIRVVIPKLYKEYCRQNNNCEEKDIESFLKHADKKLYVFVSTYTENGKFNRHKERLDSQSTGLEKYFDRLKSGKIIDYYEICPRSNFDVFLELEQLVE